MMRNIVMTAKEIHRRLEKLANRRTAMFLQNFFKTGPGQYGEGDIFLGIRVPVIRKLANACRALPERETLSLLQSPIHEARLFSLVVLVHCFSQADEPRKKQIYDLYLNNTKYINNWDLVDISAPRILGAFLITRSKTPLYRLARSSNLWERRIAIMSTFQFIRRHQFSETLKISKILRSDKEDLIQKAVGWMLREVGNRERETAEEFLRQHYKEMPRTTLRYAIEKFPENLRRMYLTGRI